MSVNVTIIGGYIGNTPELRKTKAETSVCNLRIPTDVAFGDNSDRRTEWHNVVVWGKQAETCAQHLTKGRYVTVTGHLRTNTRTVGGETVTSSEVHARSVDFGPRPSGGSSDEGSANFGDADDTSFDE